MKSNFNPNNINQRFHLKQLHLQDDTIEACKWLALVFMTVDHINYFLFNRQYYLAYCIGRLAMPLFAFILGYNLARSNGVVTGRFYRVQKRLLLYGLLATPAFMAMRGSFQLLPLNIMFLLLFATWSIYFFEQSEAWINNVLGIIIFIVAGAFAEYAWPGLALVICSWHFSKKPSLLSFTYLLLILLLVCERNGNLWALLSIPIIFCLASMPLFVPRIRLFFYAYYPIHLNILWIIQDFWK